MKNGDVAAAVALFAPDAVLRSPFTSKLAFSGPKQIAAVVGVVQGLFTDLEYMAEARTGDTAFLVSRTRVGGRELDMVDELRIGADGLIREMTVYFRPLPASAVALRMIGSGLARRKSRARGALVSAMARPLGTITRMADGLGVKLVEPGVGER
jgi:hypothetical protein